MWKLKGYDTFAREPYTLPGRYFSQAAAERAAWRRLRELEVTQPQTMSGGQNGIQDRVYIIRPDGTQYLYRVSCTYPTGTTVSTGISIGLERHLIVKGCGCRPIANIATRTWAGGTALLMISQALT